MARVGRSNARRPCAGPITPDAVGQVFDVLGVAAWNSCSANRVGLELWLDSLLVKPVCGIDPVARIGSDAKAFDLVRRVLVNLCRTKTKAATGDHVFADLARTSSEKMKLSFVSVPLSAVLLTLIPASLSRIEADNGWQSGWRNGYSSWNGSGYDLPQKVPTPWQPPADEDDPVDATPYTVPSGPQLNPYALVDPAPPGPEPADVPRAENSADDTLDDGFSQWLELITDPVAPSDPDPVTASESAAPPEQSLLAPLVEPPTEPVSGPQTEQANAAAQSTIGNLVADDVEPAPLQQEVIRWYRYPQRWMKGWDSNAEFGIDGSNGNSNTLALQTGLELNRETDLHSMLIDVDYRQASNNRKTIEDNGRLNVVYDRMVADSRWSSFGKFGLEWDRFKAFNLRVNSHAGVGYYWLREQNATLVTRFGAGASREIGAPIDDWIPEAMFAINAEHQLNARNKLTGRVDYFPDWGDFGNYRLVTDAAWQILLDDSENLSLKLAATDRYDSTPQGAKPNDIYYSLLLLYKF